MHLYDMTMLLMANQLHCQLNCVLSDACAWTTCMYVLLQLQQALLSLH
jgi:hypothetical protein